MELKKVNEYIKKFENVIENPNTNFKKDEYFVGVDLGTANIVMCVVDKKGIPVGGESYSSSVVKDGIVVDFIGAINIVKKMKEESGYKNAYVIATGGLGKIIADETECIDLYDPQLTLNGLRMIHEKVQKKR